MLLSRFVVLIPLLLILSTCGKSDQNNDVYALTLEIEDKIQKLEQSPNYKIADDYVLAIEEVSKFYKIRHYTKAWTHKNFLTSDAITLVEEIRLANLEGLQPTDYHLETISGLLSQPIHSWSSIERMAQLEVLLTDAYLIYARHLNAGKVCPEKINQQWYFPCRELNINFENHLQLALSSHDISSSLENLKPKLSGYHQLKAALASYRGLQNIRHTKTLSIPMQTSRDDEQIVLQLIALGDLQKKSRNNSSALKEAVEKFQSRHGLKPTGVLDSMTVVTLNTPIADRIATIEANLERWRWLPVDLGAAYILVNIADFSLQVIDDHQVKFISNVVIGTLYHSTPVFSAPLTHMVINPYWYIPRSIVENEILSQNNPLDYLIQNNIQVLTQDHQVVPVESIIWDAVSPQAFPYILRQEPGPENPLGSIKFVLPNPYDIYIHDTPSKELFTRNIRAFSHGCIRLQRPFDLADYLLTDDQQWDLDSIMQNPGKQPTSMQIDLTTPIPVHILYWTSWTDSDRQVQFRKDVYQRDDAIHQVLHKPLQPGLL